MQMHASKAAQMKCIKCQELNRLSPHINTRLQSDKKDLQCNLHIFTKFEMQGFFLDRDRDIIIIVYSSDTNKCSTYIIEEKEV